MSLWSCHHEYYNRGLANSLMNKVELQAENTFFNIDTGKYLK